MRRCRTDRARSALVVCRRCARTGRPRGRQSRRRETSALAISARRPRRRQLRRELPLLAPGDRTTRSSIPGKPGASHQHTFVGNRYDRTRSRRSGRSARAERRACSADDTAAYWVPALYQGTTEILPVAATVYYRRGTLAEVQHVPEQPAHDRRRREGDEPAGHARHVLELRRRVWRRPARPTVPTCPDTRGSFLRLHIRFRSAGTAGGSTAPDHKSHMALRDACEAARRRIRSRCRRSRRSTAIATRGGRRLLLASGGVYSAHADFVNAWKPSVAARSSSTTA